MNPDVSMRELGAGSKERYDNVFALIASGKILECSEGELTEHLGSLSVFHAANVGQDQTAAALLLHNLLLSTAVYRVSESVARSHETMIEIDKSNRRTNKLVIILAVIAILVGLLQVWAQLSH